MTTKRALLDLFLRGASSNHETELVERTTIGVIGAGQISSDVHIPALKSVAGAQIAWVADRDAQRARRVAVSFRVPYARLDEAHLEDLPPADVVLLAIPYGARPAYYAGLGKRGVAVYVEKPFARSVAEHDEYVSWFSPERIAVGYKMRATGAVRSLRELTRARLLGDLLTIRVRFGWPGVSTGGRYSSSLALAGGGTLFEVACHYLDIALFVCDAVDVRVVNGRMVTDQGFDIHTEATARASTREGSEVNLDIEVTNLRHTSMDLVFAFERGDVTLNMWSDGIPRVRPRGSDLVIELGGRHVSYPSTAAQMTHEQWSEWIEGLRGTRITSTCASETRVTTLLIEQLYCLGENGC